MFALNFTNEVNFMAQLWKGRFKKELAKETNDFNSSIKFDSRMFEEDIKGSIAHATMLGATGIIDKSESDKRNNPKILINLRIILYLLLILHCRKSKILPTTSKGCINQLAYACHLSANRINTDLVVA